MWVSWWKLEAEGDVRVSVLVCSRGANFHVYSCTLYITIVGLHAVSRDGYLFLRSKHFNQYFLFMRWWFSRSSKSFSLPYAIINFLFASLRLLTNFKKCSLKPSSEFPSLWLVDVLKCQTLIGCKENAQELPCHRQLPAWFYRITERLPVIIFSVKIAALGFL